MVVARDFEAVSVPYAAGVAAAMLLPSTMQLPAIPVCSAAAVCLIVIYCRRSGGNPILQAALLFVCGVLSGCSAASLPLHGSFTPFSGALDAFTGAIEGCGLHDEESIALAKALLTGDRSSMSRETVAAFREAGAAHILALSGLHLGIIYGILTKALCWTGRGRVGGIIKSCVTVACCGFYTVMTGSGASVVRAFLFICLNEAARLSPHRRRRPLSVFCAALLVQLCLNPTVIRSVGFQLSYLAMLGIYTLFPVMDSWYPEGAKFDPLRKLWSTAALSISCQIFTAPLAWWHFRSFPVYFLITNIVALPLSETLMLSAMAATAMSAAGLPCGLAAGVCELSSGLLVEFLERVASLPT